MAEDLPNYFKTFRKLHGLTQKEMSYLLGYMGDNQVSRLECRRKEPTLRVVLAYQILFDIQIEKLIPGVYREVKNLVEERLERFINSNELRPGTKHLLSGLGCLKDKSLSNSNSTQKHDIR
jgi:transcriptional regulator with XRE-family HTH domain